MSSNSETSMLATATAHAEMDLLREALTLPVAPACLADAEKAYAEARAAVEDAYRRRDKPSRRVEFVQGRILEDIEADRATILAIDRELTILEQIARDAKADRDRQAASFTIAAKAAVADGISSFEAAVAAKFAELDGLLALGEAANATMRNAGINARPLAGSAKMRLLLKPLADTFDGWRR